MRSERKQKEEIGIFVCQVNKKGRKKPKKRLENNLENLTEKINLEGVRAFESRPPHQCLFIEKFFEFIEK